MELVEGWRIGPGESKKQNKGLTGWKYIYSLGECSEGTGQELQEHQSWYVCVSLGELGTFHRIGSVDLRGKVGKSIQAGGIAYAKTLKLEVILFRDLQVISSSVSGRKSIGGRQRMEWEVLTRRWTALSDYWGVGIVPCRPEFSKLGSWNCSGLRDASRCPLNKGFHEHISLGNMYIIMYFSLGWSSRY